MRAKAQSAESDGCPMGGSKLRSYFSPFAFDKLSVQWPNGGGSRKTLTLFGHCSEWHQLECTCGSDRSLQRGVMSMFQCC